MDAVIGAVGITTSFIPVPALSLAFGTIKVIWENVQKASSNKQSLRNVAVFSTEIFMAVNSVLTENDINDHIHDLLRKFEKVLEEIHDFAEEHVAVNVFMILLRNVDVAGKIEYFQNRLQTLSMAFHIAAYGDIRAQLGKLLEGHHISPTNDQDNSLSTGSLVTQTTTTQKTQIGNYEPQRIKVSYSESCTIEAREDIPTLASRYDMDMELSMWGIAAAGSTVNAVPGQFSIVSGQGDVMWTWSLTKNRITAVDLNPAYADWNEHLDIGFPNDTTALAWFKWLQGSAAAKAVGAVLRPQSCKVSVRTTFHCWLQKIPSSIQHRRSIRAAWAITLGGHSQSSRAHKTHFTYVSSNVVGFTKVYRSGDTIVLERSIRADTEEPTTARRYHFDTEAEAMAWYSAWKNCAIKHAGENEPVRVKRHSVDPRTIQVFNREPILGSVLWPEIRLRQWGLQTKSIVSHTPSSFIVASVTTTWAWTQKGKHITVSTTIASQPDWFHSLELDFCDAKSSKAWFTYLKACGIGDMPSVLPPRAEHVTLTEATVCWMQKTNRHIQTRTAMSESWRNLFGLYKSMQEYHSHLALTSTSILPHMRISRSGCHLIQERMASENDTDIPITRTFRLPTEGEAKTWYVAWKENIRVKVSR